MHVDDCASALIFLLKNYSNRRHVNVGTGEDLTIMELAETIREVVKFGGDFNLDSSKPDGTFQKLLDTSLLRSIGWKPQISLTEGLENTYAWVINNLDI